MSKTIIISITTIICTLLICFTALYINYTKINSDTNYSITGNGTYGEPFILKDLKTGKIYSLHSGKIVETDLLNGIITYKDYKNVNKQIESNSETLEEFKQKYNVNN